MSVGWKQTVALRLWAVALRGVFGEMPYLVGSATVSKDWRDVDVVVLLSDDAFYHAVEKNIPLPEYHTKPFKYPWRAMQIGDSFTDTISAFATTNKYYLAAKQQGMKVRTRRGPIAGDTRKVRVWRIE